jgi:hypothetical protein
MDAQIDITLGLIGIAWAAIVAMLLWGLLHGLRRMLRRHAS